MCYLVSYIPLNLGAYAKQSIAYKQVVSNFQNVYINERHSEIIKANSHRISD